METDVATRVAKGVALLDEQAPGWLERINLLSLEISSSDLCVLGQVYGNFHDGCDALGLCAEFDADAVYGFNCSADAETDDQLEDFRILNKEWRRVLTVLKQKTEELVPSGS